MGSVYTAKLALARGRVGERFTVACHFKRILTYAVGNSSLHRNRNERLKKAALRFFVQADESIYQPLIAPVAMRPHCQCHSPFGIFYAKHIFHPRQRFCFIHLRPTAEKSSFGFPILTGAFVLPVFISITVDE